MLERITLTGAMLGTPQYMAPEQARGKDIDHRADLYALGVILYEMLTTALPHKGSNINHMLFSRATDPPIPLEEAKPGCDFPDSVKVILEFALATDRENRFADADAFIELVDEALEETRGIAPRRSPRREKPKVDRSVADALKERTRPSVRASAIRLSKKRRLQKGLIAGAGLALAAAVVFVLAILPEWRAYESHMSRGREAASREEWKEAKAAFTDALSASPGDFDATRALQEAENKLLLQAVEAAWERRDLADLTAALAKAREGKVQDEALGPYAEKAKLLKGLTRAETQLEQKQYTLAAEGARGLALVSDAEDDIAARVTALLDRTVAALDRAEKLRQSGVSKSDVLDIATLEVGIVELETFTSEFPHHPRLEETRAAKLRMQTALVKLKSERERRGITIDTRPPELFGTLDGKHTIRAGREITPDIASTGTHTVELTDKEGFTSRHQIEITPDGPTEIMLDHTSKVADELNAYKKVIDSRDTPEELIAAGEEYLARFKEGAKIDDVRTLLTRARKTIAENERSRIQAAFDRVRTARDDEQAALSERIAAADAFLKNHRGSEQAGQVAEWRSAWIEEQERAAELLKRREELDELLSDSSLSFDEKLANVARQLGNAAEIGSEERERIVDRLLLRRIDLGGRATLSDAAGRRAIVVTAEPVGLVAVELDSGGISSRMAMPGTNVRCVSISPDGSAAYMGTAAGRVARWDIAEGRLDNIHSLAAPITQLAALGSKAVVASTAKPGSAVLIIGDEGKAEISRLRGAAGSIVFGTRNHDSSMLALGTREGQVLAFKIGPNFRPEPVWKQRCPGAVLALAYSADGKILAASCRTKGIRKTFAWRVGNGAPTLIAEHPLGSGWLQALDGDGRLLIGGIVVGPQSNAKQVALKVGAASSIDSSGRFLIGADARGEALICYLPALLKQLAGPGDEHE
jgi:hypothetical protein